ncbi:MAG TPA: GDSL-type esterase/lipase family protein [Phycisphaerae bacterium]|nr:GDSL-type esterase/lipase family protein [Phycisphaerae bacterium]
MKLVDKAKKGGIELYFAGDNIMAGWEEFSKANWDKNFAGWKPGNFGLNGERTQNILYRIEDGELDGVNPKVIVLMAGGSNIQPGAPDSAVQDIAKGVRACIDAMHKKAPNAKFVLLAITPRNTKEFSDTARKINAEIAKFADDKEITIKFVDVGDKLADKDPNKNGALQQKLTRDGAMLSDDGFQLVADAMKPILTEWLGSPK